ncbi:hypothetical protein BH09PAT2_BH09PAT2_03130 [soil metagenome]
MDKLLVVISSILFTGNVGMTTIHNSQQLAIAKTDNTNLTAQSPFSQELPTPAIYKDTLEVAPATIQDVLDIDTLQVVKNHKIIDVHLIGIEAPSHEQLMNYSRDQQEEAIETIRKMLVGQTVFLVKDSNTVDESDQQSRYVFLKDMTFLNTELIKQGLATLNTKETSLAQYKESFQRIEEAAQEQHQGIWISPTVTTTMTPTLLPTKALSRKPTQIITPTKTISNKSAAIILTSPTTTTKKETTANTAPLSPTKKPVLIDTTTNPSPTQKPIISTTPPSTTPPANSLSADKLFTLINDHRKSLNLEPLEKNEELCKLAQSRAPELNDEIFVNHNVHAGLYSRNIPYWITENMASYPTEERIMQWWLNSYIHRKAIEGSNKYTCGACSGNSCAQLFTSFIQK